jgi:hypothetical protein
VPLIAEVDIALDMPFGTVDYSVLDSVIETALREAHIPVLSVSVGGLRPLEPEVDPTHVQVAPNSPFGPPGPFGRT